MIEFFLIFFLFLVLFFVFVWTLNEEKKKSIHSIRMMMMNAFVNKKNDDVMQDKGFLLRTKDRLPSWILRL